MKKILYLSLLTLLFACNNGTKDNKNEVEHYPNTDTTDRMENLNSPGDTSSSNSPH